MTQLHRFFEDDRGKGLLKSYCEGMLKRPDALELMGIGNTCLILSRETVPECTAFLSGLRATTLDTLGLLVEHVTQLQESENAYLESLCQPLRLEGYSVHSLGKTAKSTSITAEAPAPDGIPGST